MPEDAYAPIAALYDLSYGEFTDDVDFYENLARSVEGPVLELGVGSGRVAIPLAEAGFEVVGLDISPSMLAVAAQRLAGAGPTRGSLTLQPGDMTAFDLGRGFGFIFVAADTFQHLLTARQQLACLTRAAAHLGPGGLLVFSIRSPVTVSWDEAGAPSPLLLDWTRTDPASGDVIMKFVASEADPARMVRRMTYVYDRLHDGAVERSVFQTDLRYSTEAEVRLLLQQAGLHATHVYGDYDLTPVGVGDNLIFVAKEAEARR